MWWEGGRRAGKPPLRLRCDGRTTDAYIEAEGSSSEDRGNDPGWVIRLMRYPRGADGRDHIDYAWIPEEAAEGFGLRVTGSTTTGTAKGLLGAALPGSMDERFDFKEVYGKRARDPTVQAEPQPEPEESSSPPSTAPQGHGGAAERHHGFVGNGGQTVKASEANMIFIGVNGEDVAPVDGFCYRPSTPPGEARKRAMRRGSREA